MSSRYKHNSNSNLSQKYNSLQSRNGFPNGQQQTHLLNLWTTNSVDETYQNLFLVFIETLRNQKQQNKKIEIEIKKTYQRSSLYFLLKQNLNLRQQIKGQIQTQIVHQTQGNNFKKPQKVEIILRQLCDKIKNLRRINLLVSQTLIKMFQQFKMSRQTNIGSLGKQYIQIFIQLDAQNDFLKQSFLNEFILFQKGYDPFFLIHYQQTMKSRNSQALKKHKPIEQLFDLNISYVYRLMRAQQKMLKYMLLIDQMSNTQKDQKQLINKHNFIKKKNSQKNELQLPLVNNRSTHFDQQTISGASTIKQYGNKGLPFQPRFQRGIQEQSDQQDSSSQRKKIRSLKPIQSVQLQPIDIINKNKSAYYTPKNNFDQRSQSVDFSSGNNPKYQKIPSTKKRNASEQTEQNPFVNNSRLNRYHQQSVISLKYRQKMKNIDSLSSSQQKKWNQKKLKNMRPYLKPIKTQRSQQQQSEQEFNKINQTNSSYYDDQQNYQSSKNSSSVYLRHKRSKLSEQQNEQNPKNKQKYLSKQRLNQIVKRKPVEIQQERRPRRKKEKDSPDDYKKDKYLKDKKRKRKQSQDQQDQRQYKRQLDKKRRQSSQNSNKRSPQKQKYSSKKITKQSKEKQRQKSRSSSLKPRKQQTKYRQTQNSSQYSQQQDKIEEQSQYSSNQQQDYRKNKKQSEQEQQQPPKKKKQSKNDKYSNSKNKEEEKSPKRNESKTQKNKQQQKPTKQVKDRSVTQLKKQASKKENQVNNKNPNSKNIVLTDQNRPMSEKTSPNTNLTKKQQLKDNNKNNKQTPTQQQQQQGYQQSQSPKKNQQDKTNKNATNLNSNSKIKMIPGKINYTELENYLKDKKIMSPYDNTFKQNFKFIMSSSLNTQTYLSQFMLNQQLTAFSLCSPTASGNMIIYLWAPIQKMADQKSSIFFFKKYIDYLQKQTTFKSIVYRGQQIPEVVNQKFVLQKQKLYVRKRLSNVSRESFEFQYFFSYQIANISFKQLSKTSLLYSDEIDPFTESNSWCNPTILNSNTNELPPEFKDQWIIDENIKTIKQINSILQKDSYDTFQIGQQKQIDFDFINMSRSMATVVPRQGFISNQGYMIVVGKNIVSPDNTKAINKIQMLKDTVLYFGKGFKSAQQLANIINKYKQKLKQQDCKFAFKMFSKQIYGKYILNQPKLSPQRAYYCNWDLNFAWRDEIPGKLIHNINSVKQIYGPQNFILAIQTKGVLSLAVQITKQDFLY